jgi:hypothetical protein
VAANILPHDKDIKGESANILQSAKHNYISQKHQFCLSPKISILGILQIGLVMWGHTGYHARATRHHPNQYNDESEPARTFYGRLLISFFQY